MCLSHYVWCPSPYAYKYLDVSCKHHTLPQIQIKCENLWYMVLFRLFDCRCSGNRGPQTCLPVACGVAPPAAQYDPSSSTNTQDPREGPSLAGRTTQGLYVSVVSILFDCSIQYYWTFIYFWPLLILFLGLTYWSSAQCQFLFVACFMFHRKPISNGVQTG